MAVREACFDHLVTLIDIVDKMFDRVALPDIKYLLAQIYQWH